NGGNVYVGSSVSVGDKVVMTDKDITGLSNTTWNGTTDDASRAATEGQLQSVSDMVIGGWTATDDEGNKVKVNPENSTLNFSGDENVTVTADDENSSIDVKLNDKLNLGDDQIIIDGSNGNASITLGDTINLNGTEGTAVFGGVQVNKETGENTIIGLTNTEWSADGTYNSGRAATEEQLGDVAEWAKDQINDSGWTASTNNGAEKTDIKNGNVVDFSSADDNIKVSQEETDNGTNITFDLSDDLKLGHGDNGAYVDIFGSEGKVFVGNGTYNITIDGTTGTIGGLSNTTWNSANDYSNSTQAATEAQLQQAVNNAKQEMTDADRHLATNSGTNPDMAGATYAPDENGNVTIKEVDGTGKPTGNEVVISDVASASDLGNVADLNDDLLNKDGTNTSVVDAVNNLDDKVGSGDFTGTTHIDEDTDNLTDAIKDLDSAITDATSSASANRTEVTGDNTNITVTDNGTDDKHNYQVSLNPDINVDTVTATGNINAGSFTSGEITINKDGSNQISGLENTDWNWKDYDEGKYKGSSNAATEGQLNAAMQGTVQYDRIDGNVDKGNITLGGEKGTAIHNVAAGEISADSTDAVNGSQLYAVGEQVVNNSTAINNMGNQVSRLSNRIDKVGAGAAALAALHPLDFDPDDKLSFAAGYGNYAGENAVAVGAFYQPNEDTMFSVGGTFGNDENMVNAGVSFKLGQKSNVSRSRVSMAKELVSLRDEVAQLKALMAHAGILPSNGQLDTSDMFPDVPENHWAYEYIHELAKLGIVDGYPDGNFEGDRMMTRYEMAAIVYRAMQKGVNVDSRMLSEFEPELKLIRVDVVARDDDGNPTIERVRVNDDTTQA
ncbi:YadA-like family protein, partial [Megamonas hypermegale]|uniref:YadA-like family protein n=1 Tax=Megamonas hypermegale TaxID=158847 RepID=UPI0025A476A1